MKSNSVKVLLIANLILTTGVIIHLWINREIKLDFSDKILKVKGLVVVDSTQTERVIIGAPLPPPQKHGYRFYRGENSSVSGIMLYDSEGQERSGYVTDNGHGNVFFTLDSKTSQNVLFMAEPQGATTLKLWGKNGNQINLGSSDNEVWFNATENGNQFNLLKERK